MTIREVRVRPVVIPMREPHRTASGVVNESPLVLTDVFADDGTVGHSMIFTYTRAALAPTADLVRNVGASIVGESLAPAVLEERLATRFRLLGTQGLVGMALAALDMALWDALARRHDCSLVSLLGGAPKPVRAYAGVGFDGVVGSARAAEHFARQGFLGVKAKIGYPSVREDLAVVRAMREALGPDIALMVDYNQCLSPMEASERLRVLDDEGLAWVEEPTLAHDYAGHARVAADAVTPIQCGENWWGTLDLQHAIDAGACDLVMPDVMKIGGVSGWQRAAAIAYGHGIRVSSHLWPEVSAQLLAATPTAHWLEYIDWWATVLAEPLAIVDGRTRIEGVPGSGVSWNEAAVERHRV